MHHFRRYIQTTLQATSIFLETDFNKVVPSGAQQWIACALIFSLHSCKRNHTDIFAVPLQSLIDLNERRAMMRCENQIAPQIIFLSPWGELRSGSETAGERRETAEAAWTCILSSFWSQEGLKVFLLLHRHKVQNIYLSSNENKLFCPNWAEMRSYWPKQ